MNARRMWLGAYRAARRFVRRRLVRSQLRRRSWLPIALRWRRERGVTVARRDGKRDAARVAGLNLCIDLRFTEQTALISRTQARRQASRASTSIPRSAQSASPASGPPIPSVLRQVHSTSTTTSHAMQVRIEREQTHRLYLERRSTGRVDHHHIRRAFRAYDATRMTGRAETHRVREVGPVRIHHPSQIVVGPRVIAALRAQAASVLRSVSRRIDVPGSPRLGRAKGTRDPHATASRGITQSRPTGSRATQASRSPSPSVARASSLVWRAARPATPAPTTTPATAVEAPHSASDALTAPGNVARKHVVADAPHVREALRAQTLDPALVERLADDVIRRIERRARIERERRGMP